jgi:transcriptional regulator with XRE-family HTH domain
MVYMCSEPCLSLLYEGALYQVLTGPPFPLPVRRSVVGVDHRGEIREFLTTRRAKITPQQAGLPSYGGHRRVAGLRREEVSLLAGVSVDYYTRMERGNLAGVSEAVLDALARALRLDDAERTHLFDLAHTANTNSSSSTRRRNAAVQRVRPGIVRLLDAITTAPAWVRNDRLDVLAANPLGYALYSELFTDPVRPANNARFTFLNPCAHDFYDNCNGIANDVVAVLRSEAGRNPYDRNLTDLIGELSTRSEEFRLRWANHDVRFHRTGAKTLHHPIVGRLDLTYEALEFPGDPGLTLLAYTAEPGSTTRDALDLLAIWAVTNNVVSTGGAEKAEPL